MMCPRCGSVQTNVDDSRSTGETVRRRRNCMTCEHRWSTLEMPQFVAERLTITKRIIRRGIKGGSVMFFGIE